MVKPPNGFPFLFIWRTAYSRWRKWPWEWYQKWYITIFDSCRTRIREV